MRGYKRSSEMTEALGAALVAALREHRTMRLGQLLCCAVGDADTNLFNLYDEQINHGLREFVENEPDVYGCLHGEVANGGCALVAMGTADNVELASLLHDYAELGKTFTRALEIIEFFDRWADRDGGQEGYEGSPFCTSVRAFLAER